MLTLLIDQKWTAQEFAETFDSLNYLYNVQFALRILGRPPEDYYAYRRLFPLDFPMAIYDFNYFVLPKLLDPSYLNRFVYDREKMAVKRIRFASPGQMDFIGVGQVTRELKEFLLGIIDRVIGTEDRKLKRAREEEEIFALKIKNATAYLRFIRELDPDASPSAKHQAFSQARDLIIEIIKRDETLESLIIKKKITGVRYVEEEHSKSDL